MLNNLPLSLMFSLLVFIFFVSLLISLLWQEKKRKNLLKDYTMQSSTYLGKDEEISVFTQIFGYLERIFKPKGNEIKNRFVAAGFFNFKYIYLYVPVKFSLIIGCSLFIWFWGGTFLELNTLKEKLIPIIVVVIAGIFIPEVYLDYKAKKIREHVSSQLPYTLDLMGVCVQTGMTIEAAFAYLSIEMKAFDPTMAHFLKQVDGRARIVGMPTALQEFYEQVPTSELHSFVLTLTQSLQYGTSIYQVLTTLAKDIREVQMLTIEEKIGKMSAKMSIPLILLIMLPLVILIAAPGLMRM